MGRGGWDKILVILLSSRGYHNGWRICLYRGSHHWKILKGKYPLRKIFTEMKFSPDLRLKDIVTLANKISYLHLKII